MPSCVVKSCRNNTAGKLKSKKGVTFHKFPIDEARRDEWIRVIRASRGQPDWLPSMSSVVCSEHFDDDDIYTTEKGNRKCTLQAVPAFKLFEFRLARNRGSEMLFLDDDSQSVHSNTGRPDDEETDSKMVTEAKESSGYSDEKIQKVIIKVEPRDEVETSEIGTQTDDLGENFHVKEEPKEELATIKVEPREYAETSEIGTQTNDREENYEIKEEPKDESDMETSMDPLAQQDNAGNCASIEPDSSHSKRELNAVTAQLNESRRKTKILVNKLNRSQKRNLKMKNILKAIRLRKLIDRNAFRELTASLFVNDD